MRGHPKKEAELGREIKQSEFRDAFIGLLKVCEKALNSGLWDASEGTYKKRMALATEMKTAIAKAKEVLNG